MYKIGRLLSKATNFTAIVGGLGIALMMIHITVDVASRYLLGMPLEGTITIVANYYMVIAVFIALGHAEQKNAHISVEILTSRFPAKVQHHLAGWILLFSAAVFGLLTVRSFQEALSMHELGALVVQGRTTIPVWASYYVLPLGFGLFTLTLIYKFVVYLFGQRSGLDSERANPDATFASNEDSHV